MEKPVINSFSGAYRFLSNFYPSKVEWEGVEYPTVEHAFQAAKTRDPRERQTVKYCKTPGDAKRAGRKVTMQQGWDCIRLDVMLKLLAQKFDKDKNPELHQMLKDTGDAVLIEGNTWGDTFWGKVDGVGQNWLGKLLMFVRDSI